jgi:ferrous iron transport protein B
MSRPCCLPAESAHAPDRALSPGELRVVLVGRPNAGKSSVFNCLTGGSAHVGNFPGITVDLLEGTAELAPGTIATIVDVPGLYTLADDVPDGTDEGIAREFLTKSAASVPNLVILQIVDATMLGESLRLFQAVRARFGETRTLLLVNQIDLLERDGSRLDEQALAERTATPCVVVNSREPSARATLLAALAAILPHAPLPVPTFDPLALAREIVTPPKAPLALSSRERTQRIDRVMLHPFLGPILFLALMAGLFSCVFLIADPVAQVCDAAVAQGGKLARGLFGGGLLGSAVADGLLGGAGTVAAFLPQILLLVAGMEILEASGYLARGAFLVDRLFRIFGLGGKAFVPLLTGHACAVPAIAATRVLRDPRERLTTILVLPLMTCSARLPVYGLVIAAFVGGGAIRKASVFTGLYAFAVIAGLFAATILRRTVTKGRGLPLALEMPDYRAPQLAGVVRRCVREAKGFLKQVGTVIVVLSLVLWAALKIPARGGDEPVEARSVAAALGHALTPITKPLGYDWRINVGLIASLGARELMVGTLGVIYGIEGADAEPKPLVEKLQEAKDAQGKPLYGLPTALSLLIFFVFACQCMSTLSAIARETKSLRWPLFVLGYTYVAAYAFAFLAYQITAAVVGAGNGSLFR